VEGFNWVTICLLRFNRSVRENLRRIKKVHVVDFFSVRTEVVLGGVLLSNQCLCEWWSPSFKNQCHHLPDAIDAMVEVVFFGIASFSFILLTVR